MQAAGVIADLQRTKGAAAEGALPPALQGALQSILTMSNTPEMLAMLQAHAAAGAGARLWRAMLWAPHLHPDAGLHDEVNARAENEHVCLLLRLPTRTAALYVCSTGGAWQPPPRSVCGRAERCERRLALRSPVPSASVAPRRAGGARPVMWGTPGADGSVPGMEMTPNGGMMMDPNATGDAALAGGRPHMGGPGRGTPLCCGLVQLGVPCLQRDLCCVEQQRAFFRCCHARL